MRLWHYQLLPYLPDAQFKGQLRELVAIMRDWRDKGKTNHLLINRVMKYDKRCLTTYFIKYCYWYAQKYHRPISAKYAVEFQEFCHEVIGFINTPIFEDWHDTEYLRVCMANLYEKHFLSVGKSRISDSEWQILLDGYKNITGEDYRI